MVSRSSFTALAMFAAVMHSSAVPVAAQSNPATASGAVEEFLRAASDSNLTRMSQLFGTDDGSAARTRKPDDYQKRMVIMQAALQGVSARSLGEVESRRDGHVVVTTEVGRGACRVVVAFTAVKSDKDGWLVREFDLPAIWDGVNRPCQAPGN